MSKTRSNAAMAVAGLLVLLALALRWESAQHTITGLKSRCAVSETIDCDKVQASEYASLLGAPLSMWGVAGGLILLSWLYGARRGNKTLLAAAGALSAFSVLLALYLVYVSAFRLGAVCLYCIGMQLCIVALAVLIVPRARRIQVEARGAVLAGTLAAIFITLAFAGEAYAGRRAEFLRLYRQDGSAKLRLDLADSPVLGNPSSVHSGVLFLDFGCPYCRNCFHQARQLVADFPEEIHFWIKHYPLDRECNTHESATAHPGACLAAHAATASTLRGAGPDSLLYLFNQTDFFPQILDRLGEKLGYEKKAWRELQRSERVRGVVQRDILEGVQLNITGVPVAYIDGRPVEPLRLMQGVRKLIGR